MKLTLSICILLAVSVGWGQGQVILDVSQYWMLHTDEWTGEVDTVWMSPDEWMLIETADGERAFIALNPPTCEPDTSVHYSMYTGMSTYTRDNTNGTWTVAPILPGPEPLTLESLTAYWQEYQDSCWADSTIEVGAPLVYGGLGMQPCPWDSTDFGYWGGDDCGNPGCAVAKWYSVTKVKKISRHRTPDLPGFMAFLKWRVRP